MVFVNKEFSNSQQSNNDYNIYVNQCYIGFICFFNKICYCFIDWDCDCDSDSWYYVIFCFIWFKNFYVLVRQRMYVGYIVSVVDVFVDNFCDVIFLVFWICV